MTNKPSEYITELFHKLREDIAEIKHRLFTEKPKLETEKRQQYSIDAIHENPQSGKEAEMGEAVTIRARLNLPKAVSVDAETHERHKPWKEDRNFILQCLLAAVGAIVALIYAFQLGQMIQTNHHVRTQQRPYLWQISSVGKVGKPDDVGNIGFYAPDEGSIGKVAIAALRVQNFGHTPAIVTKFTANTMVGRNAVDRLEMPHDWVRRQIVMPEGRVDQFTTEGPGVITANNLMDYRQYGMAFVIRIHYEDTDGNSFESDLCEYTPKGFDALWEYCPPEKDFTRLIDCSKETCE